MRKAERQRLSTKRDLQMVHRRKQYPALFKVPHFVMKSQPGQPGSNIMEQFWKWPRAWLEALVIGPVSRYRWCLELKVGRQSKTECIECRMVLSQGSPDGAPFHDRVLHFHPQTQRWTIVLGSSSSTSHGHSAPLAHHSATCTYWGIAQARTRWDDPCKSLT